MGNPIGFPLSTAPGVKPGESGGRLINCYAEAAAPGSRNPSRITRCPGLRPAFTAGTGTWRGSVLVGNELYVINDDKAYVVTFDGTTYTVMALSGTVPGTGPVFVARNMNVTPQILIVHSAGMSQIASGSVSDFSDADLPAPNSVSFMDSYFFPTIGDGRAWASAVNDIGFAGTDFTTAEGKPDGLLRSIPSASVLLLMGTTSIEVWSDAGNATGFPFSRSTVIPIGLWGAYAVAGWEDGYTDNVCFVANDNTVRRMVGYEPVKISNPDLDALIGAVTDRTLIEASVYIDGGRPVFVLSGPTWTWEWNASTQQWNERESLRQSRWRAHGGINAFNNWYAFDTVTNDVYLVDRTFRRENADQLVIEVRSVQAHRFPGRAVIRRASFDFMTGVGIAAGISPIETDPVVQVSWSKDGGLTFGNPLTRALGKQGQVVPITVRNCGETGALGWQWRLVIADPVDVALYGGAVDAEPRAAA